VANIGWKELEEDFMAKIMCVNPEEYACLCGFLTCGVEAFCSAEYKLKTEGKLGLFYELDLMETGRRSKQREIRKTQKV
jgi:hypothetical protein